MDSPWNDGQLFSSGSVEWATPEWLFDRLDMEFAFQLDVCANNRNAKVDPWIDAEENALTAEWHQCIDTQLPTRTTNMSVWMNPPWGRQVGRFIKRAYEQCKKHRLVVVCLLPATTDTKYWRDWVWKASEVRFVTGRLHFVRDDGHTGPAPKGAAVVVFTPWSDGPPQISLMERGDK